VSIPRTATDIPAKKRIVRIGDQEDDMITCRGSLGTRALVLGLLTILAAITPIAGHAETPVDAVARIRSRPHSAMPPPQMAHATGAAGKGMTIENGTGHLLLVHFSGPVSTSVEVPDGGSAGVELAVGSYEVAAEVPNSTIVPFYGKQSYQHRRHYWLKFFVQSRWR
jgi:hypothetical protein